MRNFLPSVAMTWSQRLFGGRSHASYVPRARSVVRENAEVRPLKGEQSTKGKTVAWIILVVAGIFEVGWAIGLKYTAGFTRLWPTVGTVLAMVISLWLLGVAMKSLPVGTAYSVWVGVGAAGTVALGIVLLGEPANAARLISVALIIAGIVGLKLATPG